MSKYRELILSPENLSWAWRKARRQFGNSELLINPAEVAAFELDLEAQLGAIQKDFAELTYQLSPLCHVPQPKRTGEDGEERLRQSFYVSVRDQVAWLAVVNAIGPTLDAKMPPWSYGHRLYQAAWYEGSEGEARLEIGPYRHSTGHLYRKFKHSWPLYRRHISITARCMANGSAVHLELDDAERAALAYEDRPNYFQTGRWQQTDDPKIFYAFFDLEKFYPKIRRNAIIEALGLYLDEFNQDRWLRSLIDNLLSFTVSRRGSCLLGDPTVQPVTHAGEFEGIPTGLMVAGFLANVAMLPLDELVAARINSGTGVAHFRFVDDHALLAKNFTELLEWIEFYQRNLLALGIGPTIAPDKYDPPRVAELVGREKDPSIVATVAEEAQLDGNRPAKLMTKTLALVSDLAGMDFDILAEPVREQRLAEIEWLLTADIPEHEIRGDTRSAFAAGRLTNLIPIAFSPPFELLEASRELVRLNRTTVGDDQEYLELAKSILKERLGVQRKLDTQKRRERAARYFKLIFHAFCDHPDKTRMFVRMFDYCRSTGHDGVHSILSWVVSRAISGEAKTSHFYSALALQTMARHIASATVDMSNRELLARQRFAARQFLRSVSKGHASASIQQILLLDREQHACDVAAASALRAAIAAAAHLCAQQFPNRPLSRRLEKLRVILGAPSISDTSAEWEAATGARIGVWSHLFDRWSSTQQSGTGLFWELMAPQHDPAVRVDWLNLRKFPHALPEDAIDYLNAAGASVLKLSDAGWLQEVRASQTDSWPRGSRSGPAGARLRRYKRETTARESTVSAVEWVEFLRNQSAYDPRRSEWTALELLRQLVSTASLEDLDQLHPSNILLPRAWLENNPPASLHQPAWTWEAWKYVIRNNVEAIKLSAIKIDDYRRSFGGRDLTSEELWDSRLRGCGLLLLGLCALTFELPSLWNIRGLERDVSAHVRSQLEQVALSSRSLAIIETALLPRSLETRLMMQFGWAFFGSTRPISINDTTTDPPLIRNASELLLAILHAQDVLERNQLSVLHHAPRQLIPMNVIQMTNSAVELPQEDEQ